MNLAWALAAAGLLCTPQTPVERTHAEKPTLRLLWGKRTVDSIALPAGFAKAIEIDLRQLFTVSHRVHRSHPILNNGYAQMLAGASRRLAKALRLVMTCAAVEESNGLMGCNGALAASLYEALYSVGSGDLAYPSPLQLHTLIGSSPILTPRFSLVVSFRNPVLASLRIAEVSCHLVPRHDDVACIVEPTTGTLHLY